MQRDNHQAAQSDLQQEIQKQLSGYQQFIERLPETIYESCMDASKKDVNKFVDCMLKKSKKVDKQLKAFDFKMLFMQNSYQLCQKSGAQPEICKNEAKANVDKYYKDFEKNVQ